MDILNTAINTTFVGFSIVFLALILLSFIIYVFSKFNQSNKTKNKTEENPTLDANQSNIKPYINNEEEIIAVLTAAVAAISRRTPDMNFKIKSFKRIPQHSPLWNKASRINYLSNKI